MSTPNQSASRRSFPRIALASALGVSIALHASAATALTDKARS